MNITLTITGGTAAEIQQAVQDLSNSFAIGVKGELLEQKIDKPNEEAVTLPVLKRVEPKAGPVAETPPTTANVTLEQVRVAVQAKAQAGKRTELKSLLTEFEAENVTALPKEKYAGFLTKVNAL